MILSGIRTGLILVGAPLVVAATLLQSRDGGYDVSEWGGAGLLVIGLLVVVALTGLPSRGHSRRVIVSLAFFAAYAGWGFLSILWAEVQGDAWEGANRTLLYLLLYALVVLLPWRAETVVVLLAATAVLTAAVGVASLAQAALADDPDAWFISGRFSAPMGYQNGNCALFLMGLFAGLPLATRRELAPLARGVLLASAAMLAQLAVLTQSRASLAAVPLTLAFLLAVLPGRARLFAGLAGTALVLAATGGLLLDVFSAVREGGENPAALDRAAVAVVATGVAVLLAGTLVAALDAKLELSPRAARFASQAVVGSAVVVAVVGLGAAARELDHPVRSLEHAWSSFQQIDEPGETRAVDSTYYLSGLSGNRYDLWRVALQQFRAHPLVGVGSENFAVDYFRERRTLEASAHPHSLPLRALGQTGLVGALLLAGALGAGLLAGLAALRRGPPARLAAATGLTVFVYWLVHGAVDWFWELPGLGVPAVLALGLAASLAPRDTDRPERRRVPRAPATTAVGLGLAAAAASLATTWLAAKETEAAGARWRVAPDEAFARLDRARTLNPLSEQPDLFAAVIAGKLGDHERMRAHLLRVVERKPSSWYAHFELGLLAAVEGDTRAALAALEVAERLNPNEPAVDEVRRRVREDRPVSLGEFDALFLERVRAVGR